MRKILFGTVLLGAVSFAATGCIIVGDDDDDNGGGGSVGDISLAWTVDPGCPAGATTAELTALPTSGGQPFINLFNCTDTVGVIDDVPVGTYDVFITITDGDVNNPFIFAQSFAEAGVSVTRNTTVDVPAFTILSEDAFFSFDWQINEGGSIAPDCAVPHPNYLDPDCNAGGALPCPPDSTCAVDGACRVDQAGIGFLATLVGNSEIIPADEFVCAPQGTGQAGPFPLGSYSDVIIDIVDANGASYYSSEALPAGEIDVGNEVENLGGVVFDL